MHRLALLLTGVVFSCSTTSESGAETWVGRAEPKVRETYAPIATDFGVIHWGGSGARRLYFALGDGTQAGSIWTLRGPS